MSEALVLRLIGVDGFGCSEPVFAAFQQHWRTLLDVEIRHHRAKRSLDQNAYLREKIAEWRARSTHIDNVHATMGIGYEVCANELTALLPPAPSPNTVTEKP